MKSVKLCGNSVAAIAEVPEPTPQAHEVVIQTAVSALCGSELNGYRNAGSAKGNSGHEAAGVVLRVGSAVTTLQPGQRVGVSSIAGCGACGYCARGQYTWCTKRRFYGSMHAEQFVTAANACHVLPDDVDWKTGVLISGDGMGVPFHTSTKIIRPDTTTIAVFGAGPIGLGNILLQAFLGKKVIAVDLSAPRLELATRLGAAATFNPNDTDVVAAIRDYTGGLGADLCIEAAGRPETALNCFAAVKTGGQVFSMASREPPTCPSASNSSAATSLPPAHGSTISPEFTTCSDCSGADCQSSLITDVYPLAMSTPPLPTSPPARPVNSPQLRLSVKSPEKPMPIIPYLFFSQVVFARA